MDGQKSENRPKQTRRPAPRSAWRKGQSGNPGGRPRTTLEVRELARQHGPQAIHRLCELMYSRNETVALRAADLVLNRGYGLPTAAIEPLEQNEPVLIHFLNDRNLQSTDSTGSSGDFP